MTLSEYIREVGSDEFAKRFKVTPRAALSYMRGERSPRPRLAKQIVEKTPVDWAGVYAGAIKRKPN